jgi:hypothetical protein
MSNLAAVPAAAAVLDSGQVVRALAVTIAVADICLALGLSTAVTGAITKRRQSWRATFAY